MPEKPNLVFKLYANCIPVKGMIKSCIYDLQREDLYYIPNGLYEILTLYPEKSIAEVKKQYNPDLEENIDTFFEFLMENDLGFFTDEPDNFPKLDVVWSTPEIITNCIIEYGKWSSTVWTDVCDQLSELGCKFIEYRFYKPVNFDDLYIHLSALKNTFVRNISLIICYHHSVEEWDFHKLLVDNQRIGSIVFHSSPEGKKELRKKIVSDSITFTSKKLDTNLHCGNIARDSMTVNLSMFTESLNFNNCLNKKISIDKTGSIKNCPSMTECYGNIQNTKLVDVASSKEFQSLWKINKDEVNICKVCEYRYACLDCRAFVEEGNNDESKPLKCGYDPYTGNWETWSKNPLKFKQIKNYGLDKIVLLLVILFSIASCKKSSQNALHNLTKLSEQKLVERARYANFPDISELTYINEQGETISRDSFIKMENFEDLAFDDYVDRSGIVRVTVIRKANKNDKEFRDRINLAISEGPPLDRIDINCDSLSYLLESALLSDQKNRENPNSIDWNVDLENLATITSILEVCGMPTTKNVSKENIKTIWLVLQHSLPKYQKKYLPILKDAAEIGDLDMKDIYMMEDRILVNEGKPQIYGTQLTKDNQGNYILHKVLDPQNLDKRRKEAGFEPIDEYLYNEILNRPIE